MSAYPQHLKINVRYHPQQSAIPQSHFDLFGSGANDALFRDSIHAAQTPDNRRRDE